MTQPEPWLRGTLVEMHFAAAHMLHTFEQAREELPHFCSDLSLEAIWKGPHPGVASLGFQLRHIAGSVDRLTTYLQGEQLNEKQIARLKTEHDALATFDELMASLEAQFQRTEAIVRATPTSSYEERRVVGRKQMPTTVGGLIVHISEHTQRHLGQAVLTSKLLKS